MTSSSATPVALITGSSRGIGKGIAIALAREGFAVGVNGRTDSDHLRATVAELEQLGVAVAAVPGDISVLDNHAPLLDATEAALGPITTLVNNAGVAALVRGDLLDMSVESYDHCMATNLRGTFFLSQAFAKRLLDRDRDPDLHHCMITISSANSTFASINRGEYCMSKIGLTMLNKLFATRLGGDGIGVYEIQPGMIKTDMSRPAWDIYEQRIRDEQLSLIPRMGTPDDIGEVAATLATGQLSFATGQAVQADGGLWIPRL